MNANPDSAAKLGAGGAIPPEFWPAFGKALAPRNWATIPVLDFSLSVVNKKFSPHSWLCSMIDGHQKSVVGAMAELRAATHPLEYPAYRLLVVVVYQTVTQAEIDALLKNQLGHRSDLPQVVVAVIHHPSGKLHSPHWSNGYWEPEFDRELGDVLQAALTEALGPHAS